MTTQNSAHPPQPGTGIEALRAGDAVEVSSLWQDCGLSRPWNPPEADFLRALGGQASTVLGVRDDGDHVVATVMVGHDGHRGWVYYLAVAPDLRGRGLGRALLAEAEGWLRERGIPKVMLMVRAANTQVLDYYEHLGFGRSTSVVLERWLDRP
ncbi:MAG: GNAT family acetyltransferase [Propionibacterium sp.]|nr:GNAT family acetyltransferase [Propionibacterium sp.]